MVKGPKNRTVKEIKLEKLGGLTHHWEWSRETLTLSKPVIFFIPLSVKAAKIFRLNDFKLHAGNNGWIGRIIE